MEKAIALEVPPARRLQQAETRLKGAQATLVSKKARQLALQKDLSALEEDIGVLEAQVATLQSEYDSARQALTSMTLSQDQPMEFPADEFFVCLNDLLSKYSPDQIPPEIRQFATTRSSSRRPREERIRSEDHMSDQEDAGSPSRRQKTTKSVADLLMENAAHPMQTVPREGVHLSPTELAPSVEPGLPSA